MLKLEDMQTFLDQLLPSNGVNDFCPNGLQVEGKPQISKIATAVSANIETLEAAIEKEVDVLIVHHGIFWHRDSHVIYGTKKKKLQLLLEHEISLFAYHLPLDMHPKIGNNWKAALDMNWKNLQPFGFIEKSPIGVQGTIQPCSRDEFKKKLESYYNHPATYAWGGNEEIRSVALISGGAHKSILEAAQKGIDAYITGSFDEPVWHQAKEEGVNFYALGHSATERIGPMALAYEIQQFLNLPCEFIDVFNPF